MSEINSENVVDTTAENTVAENTTETKITPEEMAQNMTEVGFMANVLKDSNLGGATIKNAPLLGASNDTVEESDEETDVITMAELEKGGKHNTVRLGRQGESNTQTVEFDLGDWMSEVPNGVATIVARRAGESETYLAIGVAYNVETHIATWPITSIDTAYPGYGEAEIRISNSDQTIVKKSARFRTYVEKSVEDYTSEAVTPPYWAVNIINQAQTASEDAASASRSAGIASSMATSAESAASDSEASARRAKTASQTAVTDAATALASSQSISGLVNYNQRVNAQMAPHGMTSIVTEMEPGGIGSDGVPTGGEQHRRSKDFIPVTSNGSLYLKCDGTHDIFARLYDANQAFVSSIFVLHTASSMEKTSRLPANAAYVKIYIVSVGADENVYDLDWAVCVGAAVVALAAGADITALPIGEYYSDIATASSLVNCPVTSTAFRLRIIERYSTNNMAIIYAQNGEMFVRFNLASNGAWYKFTGTAVS